MQLTLYGQVSGVARREHDDADTDQADRRPDQVVAIGLEPVDLGALVNQVVADLVTTSGRDIACHVDAPLLVEGDPHRLWQVFSNLLSNAIKYAPDGPITITCSRTGDLVRTVVADRGPGIPDDDLEIVFEPFRRLGSGSGAPGSGLGLHIARLLVEGHGGRIRAESAATGASFVVELPVLDPARP